MTDKQAQAWSYIFNQFGEEPLRNMLFKAAEKMNDDSRLVVEFDGNRAMDVTDHVEELEKQL